MPDYQIHLIPLLSDNYSFIFKCNDTDITACIDPADGEGVELFLQSHHMKLDFILNTHHHYDHIAGNKYLKNSYDCKIIGYIDDKHRIPSVDLTVKNNDIVKIGNHNFQIMYIPGHTSGHICYFNNIAKILFIGDTLFSSGCGRIFEGTYQQMYDSLELLKKLPSDTKIYCAHEYSLNNIEFALTLEPTNQDLLNKQQKCKKLRDNNKPTIPSTLADELKTNPFLRTLSPELRNSINKTSDAYNIDVFTQIRKMKDRFVTES